MNTRRFIMTSTIFLIVAGKYDLAAQYMIHDAFNNGNRDTEKNGKKPAIRTLAREMQNEYNSIKKQYPSRLSVEQMREIAGEIYQQINKSLISGKTEDSLVYKEKPSLQ